MLSNSNDIQETQIEVILVYFEFIFGTQHIYTAHYPKGSHKNMNKDQKTFPQTIPHMRQILHGFFNFSNIVYCLNNTEVTLKIICEKSVFS